jgi:hypothetical protein
VAGAASGGGTSHGGDEVCGGQEQFAGDLPRGSQGQARGRHRQLQGAIVQGHPCDARSSLAANRQCEVITTSPERLPSRGRRL